MFFACLLPFIYSFFSPKFFSSFSEMVGGGSDSGAYLRAVVVLANRSVVPNTSMYIVLSFCMTTFDLFLLFLLTIS